MKRWFKKWQQTQRKSCAMLVAAGGSSARMGENKLFLPLDEMPILARTLREADRCLRVDEIIVAAREEDIVAVSQLCRDYGIQKPVKVVRGGENRAKSVYLAALEAGVEIELLAVHDGDRPLATAELMEDVIARAERTNAAAPAVPVKDTIKVAAEGIVESTPERKNLFAVQTPQVFDAQLLKAALQAGLESEAELTDDCSAVERLGKQVYLTEGSYENIKITTPIDLVIAEAILAERDGL